MFQFISFGSGSCGNCSYLSNGRDAVLIDAGVGIRQLKRYVREYGLRTSLLRGILLTHDHTDHTKAAGYVSADYNLMVYATKLVHDGIVGNYHTTRKIDIERRVCIEKDKVLQLGSLRITPFHVPHDSADNVGYCIESDGEVFTLMTDVGTVTEQAAGYIRRSNYLVIEADYDSLMLAHGPYPKRLQDRIRSGTGHLSNEDCAQALLDNYHEGLRHVWLCHRSEANNSKGNATKTIQFKLGQYGIIVGKDFELDELNRGVPTGPWTLQSPKDRPHFSAALFDLDGTLLDTEAQYTEFWGRVGQRVRPDLPDFNSLIKGTTLTQIFDLYIPEQYQEQITAELDAWEAQMDYHLMPGAENYIHRLRAEGVKTALVTSSNQKKMAQVLRQIPHFYTLFDCVLTSEDFARSKPFPDCYLKAAQVLGVQPSDCVVFEDAFSGLKAARDAGMYVVGLATTNSAEAIRDYCDTVVNDFNFSSL